MAESKEAHSLPDSILQEEALRILENSSHSNRSFTQCDIGNKKMDLSYDERSHLLLNLDGNVIYRSRFDGKWRQTPYGAEWEDETTVNQVISTLKRRNALHKEGIQIFRNGEALINLSPFYVYAIDGKNFSFAYEPDQNILYSPELGLIYRSRIDGVWHYGMRNSPLDSSIKVDEIIQYISYRQELVTEKREISQKYLEVLEKKYREKKTKIGQFSFSYDSSANIFYFFETGLVWRSPLDGEWKCEKGYSMPYSDDVMEDLMQKLHPSPPHPPT
ncbi:MAG: hypothetical protein UW70_C0072G0004 [Candidatus Peregrinibacteria bacterium GW2011_GWA2_44_7]|nr:MAG: hypothetical protein UW70_C0072G0004 [Candidatus Peregrinibacteria bacterium GW2011_GWA2_44_7]